MSEDLPPGWVAAPLQNVVTFNPKHDRLASRDTVVSFIPMAAVSDETGSIIGGMQRPLAEVWKGYAHFAEGDVLFAKITPCMENGKAAIARGLVNGLGCGSTEFFVLRPSSGILSEYLWHFVRQLSFREEAKRVMSGAVGQQRVPVGFLQDYPIPLPPLAEQRRIVARIEALFARIRQARADLTRVPPLAKQYWKRAVDTALDVGREAGWPERTLDEVAIETRNGISSKPTDQPPGTPILRISAVRAGRVALDDVRFHRPETEAAERPYLLRERDLLFVRFNGNPELVAACGMVREIDSPRVYPDKLIRMRLDETQALPEFVELAAGSSMARDQLTRHIKTAAGQHGISGADLRKLRLPIPDIATQATVASISEAKRQQIGAAEREATRTLALLDRLEQAILAKAFRGELVPQDPNDEPAAVTLARARPAPAAPPRRGRRKGAAASAGTPAHAE